MKILVTGGKGFIGGRLALHLNQTGNTVLIGSRNQSQLFYPFNNLEVRRTDWYDINSLQKACKDVDVIVHTAGMNANDCSKNPLSALEFNGLATGRLVEAAIKAEVRLFLHLSSAHVYANPLIGEITEKNRPLNLHPYASSNLAGEQIVLFASERSKLKGFILRLSNVFGAPVLKNTDCWDLYINNLCKQVVKSRQLTIRNNGGIEIDFVAMSKVVEIISQLIKKKNQNIISLT